MKVSKSLTSVFAGLAALVLFTACAPATKAGDEVSASSVVYALTQTPGADVWPNLKVGVNAPSGKTVSHLTYTFAVDANMLLSATGFGYNLQYNDLWSPNQDVPTAPKSWGTTTDLASLTWGNDASAFAGVVDKGASLLAWYSGAAASTLYVKQIDVTYSDSSTEVITFTTDAETPVHIVATAGTTDVAFTDRLWVYNAIGDADHTSDVTQGVATVAF